MTHMEVADTLIAESIDLLAQRLCPDCPVRNWCGQLTLEGIGVDEDSTEESRLNLAVNEGQVVGALAAAAFVKQRIGCDGRQEAEPCKCCGNEGICPALTRANEYIGNDSED